MSILFHCTRCQAALKAADRLAGILGYCPKCSGTVLFPGERRMSVDEEAGLGTEGRLAERQGLWDRFRPRMAQPWGISLVVHTAVVILLAILTWQAAAQPEDDGRKVNILLDLGEKDGALRYRGPRDIVLKKKPTPQADLLTELAKDRPPSQLIEVGPARGAPVIRLTDLDFEKGPAASGFSTRFMGLGARGESFIYIVDKSGSMWTDRLAAAKAELRASIEMLPYAARFHVMFYDDGGFLEMPADKLVNASRSNKQRCYRMMAAVTPEGGTNPQPAFLKAFKLRPDIIFFLTDGQLDAQTPRIAETVRLMNKNHAADKVTVHTIGFINELGEAVLKKIAQENHGAYRFVGRAAAMRLLRRRSE